MKTINILWNNTKLSNKQLEENLMSYQQMNLEHLNYVVNVIVNQKITKIFIEYQYVVVVKVVAQKAKILHL